MRPVRYVTYGGSHPIQHVVASTQRWPRSLSTLCGRSVVIEGAGGKPRFKRKARITLRPTGDHRVCDRCLERLAEFDDLSVSG